MVDDAPGRRIGSLTPSQRAALLARALGPAGRARKAAEARPVPTEAPLSFAQQRLWFLDRLQGPNPTYNMPLGFRIRGRLDVPKLTVAIERLVQRHEALRTRIVEGADGPTQYSIPAGSIDGQLVLRLVDVSANSPSEALKKAEAFSTADAQRPFDLLRDPLFRATLYSLGEEEYRLYLTLHHIVSDGWSNAILLRDLLVLYHGASPGSESALPALPASYLEFACWQRSPERVALLERQIEAWLRRLDGAPQGLHIATDFPRPAVLSYRGALVSRSIGRGATGSLRDACREQGASLFMGTVAIFATLLGRLGAGKELLIGCPIANRPAPEFEELVGFFSNTLALRIDLDGDPSFSELVDRIRVFMLDAYSDQEAPFERLVDRLGGSRTLDRTPLFEAMLSFQKAAGSTLQSDRPGLTLEPLERRSGHVHFPLTLGITETEEGLELRLGYQTDLFSAPTASRLMDHFETLVDLVGRQPAVPLSRLELLGVDELEELDRLSGDPLSSSQASDLLGMVDEQASRFPSEIAVEAIDGNLTYAEFISRANRLAGYFCALGTRPGRPIAICAERRVAMAVSVLAALKAGCPVLMLDPALPAQRLATLIEVGEPDLILAHRRFVSALPPARRVVVLEDAVELALAQPILPQAPPERPLTLAYVLFTSGSTGRPKGVAMGARAFGNLIDWQRRHPLLGRRRRTAQFAALGFDVAFQEMFASWTTGGTLVMLDEETRRDPRAIHAFLAARRIQRLYFPMAALQTLAEVATRDGAARLVLEDVIVAGEALEVTPAVRTFFASLQTCTLHNHYGPTETHVVTTETLLPPTAGWPSRPSIGRPVDGVVVRIVGPNGERVPLGVEGELWIGGVQLADGYIGQPTLTSERFVTDATGVRYYRSGDLVRQHRDGKLDFVGRVDDQVKIRGFRVEPSEVAAVLKQHDLVADAAVVAVRQSDGGLGLVAYVVPRAGKSPEAAALRSYLAACLPIYCLPASIMFLAGLPLSPNGKIDRKRLPPPEILAPSHADLVVPETPTEKALASLWAALLGVGQVSALADFFEIGGHSLLAVRFLLRLNEVLGVDVPLRLVFERPTLRDLASAIDHLPKALPARPPFVALARDRPLPLSFAQERLYFLQQLYEGSAAYTMPAAIRLAGPLDVAALERAFSIVIRRHEILRTRFISRGAELAQVVDPPMPAELQVIDLSGLDDAELRCTVDREVAALPATRFDLAVGPLMRLRLLKLGVDDALLLICFHHIIMDEWSIDILRREIGAVYAGEPESTLPTVAAQYADFAVWQRSWLDQSDDGAQAAYWRQRLAGAPVATQLPFDRARPARRSGNGGVVPLKVPAPVSAQLRRLASQSQSSTFMTLLAALASFLSRVIGERDIVIGTPVANRVVPEIENSIGFFVNMIALRLSVDGTASFSALLRQAREVTLDAFANQDLPFERVVEVTRPARQRETTPFVNVVLAYRDSDSAGLELPGVAASSWPLPGAPVKYDLIFALAKTGEAYTGAIEYDADLFDRGTVSGLADYFVALLASQVEMPERPLAELGMEGQQPATAATPQFEF